MFRSYDPQLGRFNQIDPLTEFLPGINPYQYAFNNPILFNDPYGLAPKWWGKFRAWLNKVGKNLKGQKNVSGTYTDKKGNFYVSRGGRTRPSRTEPRESNDDTNIAEPDIQEETGVPNVGIDPKEPVMFDVPEPSKLFVERPDNTINKRPNNPVGGSKPKNPDPVTKKKPAATKLNIPAAGLKYIIPESQASAPTKGNRVLWNRLRKIYKMLNQNSFKGSIRIYVRPGADTGYIPMPTAGKNVTFENTPFLNGSEKETVQIEIQK